MSRVARIALSSLIVFVAPGAAAQGESDIALTLSPGFVRFNGFGSGVSTAVAQLSMTRALTSHTGAELTAFAVMPLEVVSVQPTCAVGSACVSRSTPSALTGALAAGYLHVGESPLRLSAGYGFVSSSGSEGPGARSSGALQFGLDWSRQRNGGIGFTAGVRALQLGSPISGARQLVLPGVGIRF